MNPLLKDLNPPQIKAVKADKGAYLIIAGAGSGKTTALTRRIAYLIGEHGVHPTSILAVTFTNKAAAEMRDRVYDLIGQSVSRGAGPLIGTFHSVCVRILRENAGMIGYNDTFTILDAHDQQVLIKKIMREMELSTQQFAPRAILETISRAKNNLSGPEQFTAQADSYFSEQVAAIYDRYQRRLKEDHVMDFDDLIRLTIMLFTQFPEVLEKYQRKFEYILVDEYQDTNHAQYKLIDMLAKKYGNIFVVGDDWQCFPATTKITTPKGEKPIKDIQKGYEVQAGSGQGKVCTQKVTDTKKHKMNGELIRIQTKSGKSLEVTPNHLVFGMLGMKKQVYYVYLMWKKGMGYRVGVVQGVRVSKSGVKSNGVNVRANQERADRMWILTVCKKRSDAQMYESLYSVKYGIPVMVFRAKGRKMTITQAQIDTLYASIDTESNAKKVFEDFHLDFAYPHHIPQATIRHDRKRLSITYTLFSDPSHSQEKPWATHRISISSTDKAAKKILEKNGYKTRIGKSMSWRYEKSTKSYAQVEEIVTNLKKILPDAHCRRCATFVPGERLDFLPAGHIRESMFMPVYSGKEVVLDEVVKVEEIQFSGAVYDLNVANVHNYIANDFLVHNSIYRWRGADVSNILGFGKDYPKAEIIKLEQNYRSTQSILDAAYGVIEPNASRSDKQIWTDQKGGKKVTVYEAGSEAEEAAYIADIVTASANEGMSYNDFVVLYRTNAQSRAVEEYFLKSSVPYRIVGGIRFYERKEVKDMIAYLQLILNHSNMMALERALSEPRRGVGPKTQEGWIRGARAVGANFLHFAHDDKYKEKFAEAVTAKSKQVTIRAFAEFVLKAAYLASQKPLTHVIAHIYEASGYRDHLSDGTPEGEARHENVQELLSVAAKYDDMQNALPLFLEEVALASDTDKIAQETDMVHLMTMHSAKGLEFPVVFIVGLEEGLIPHNRALVSHEEMEEERRLMYVGVTRAKREVHLLYTRQRMIFGSLQANPPSRFLDDIPEDLKEEKESKMSAYSYTSRPVRAKKFYDFSDHGEDVIQIKEEPTENIEKKNKEVKAFADGDRVKHAQFGVGVVVASDAETISIVFKGKGLTRLAKEYAELTKI